MSLLNKILGIASIGSTFAGVVYMRKFVTCAVTVVALTVICALLVSTLLLAGFYGIYVGLISYGLQPIAAILILSTLALAITAAFFWVALLQIRHLRSLPYQALHREVPAFAQVSNIAESFVKGFMAHRPAPHGHRPTTH